MFRFAYLVTLLAAAASKKLYSKSANQQVIHFVEVDITAQNQTVWVPPNAIAVLSYKIGKTDPHIACHWMINDKYEDSSKSECADSTTLRIGPIRRELNSSIFRSIVHLPNQPRGERVKRSKLATILIQCYPIRIAVSQTFDVAAGIAYFKAFSISGSRPVEISLTQTRNLVMTRINLAKRSDGMSWKVPKGTTAFTLTGKNHVSVEEIKWEIENGSGDQARRTWFVRYFIPANVTVTGARSSSTYMLDVPSGRRLEFQISSETKPDSSYSNFNFRVQGIDRQVDVTIVLNSTEKQADVATTNARYVVPTSSAPPDVTTTTAQPTETVKCVFVSTSSAPTTTPTITTSTPIHSESATSSTPPQTTEATPTSSKSLTQHIHQNDTMTTDSTFPCLLGQKKGEVTSSKAPVVLVLAAVLGCSTLLLIVTTTVALFLAYRYSRELKVLKERAKAHCNLTHGTLRLRESAFPMTKNPVYEQTLQRTDETTKISSQETR